MREYLEVADVLARAGAAFFLPIVCVLLVRLERRVHSLERVGQKLELDVALLRQAAELDRDRARALERTSPQG